MKKLFITTLLSTIALAAIVTLPNTASSIDKLLMENIAALADDPVNWIDDGEGGVTRLTDCFVYGANTSNGRYHCAAGTGTDALYSCGGSVEPIFINERKKCVLP
jgi:hypothetical protein